MQERMSGMSELKPDELQKRSDILDRCLQAITQKQATIESCVRQYPEFKELSTLLYAAQAVQNIRPESLSQMSKSEVRQRILEHYRARKPRRTVQHAIRQSSWFRPIAASCAVILMMFLSGFGLVKASAATLPGDSLYPVKRAAENVQIALASGDTRTDLLQNMAVTRLVEVSTLAEENRPIPQWVVNDTSYAVNVALEAQPDAMKRQQMYSTAQQVIQKAETVRAINPGMAESVLAGIAASASTSGLDSRVTSATEPPTILPALGRPEATEQATDLATRAGTEIATPSPTLESSAEATSSPTPGLIETEDPTESATAPTNVAADAGPTEPSHPTRVKPGKGRPTKVAPPNGKGNGNDNGKGN